MLLYLYLLVAAAFSFAVAEDYDCIDPQPFIDKLKLAHGVCGKELNSLANSHSDSCYIAYRKCTMRELNILNEVNGVDLEKLIELNKSFTTKKDGFRERFLACDHIPETANNVEKILTCITEYCREGESVRAAFTKSAVEFCM